MFNLCKKNFYISNLYFNIIEIKNNLCLLLNIDHLINNIFKIL
jgi:hypothetical protein